MTIILLTAPKLFINENYLKWNIYIYIDIDLFTNIYIHTCVLYGEQI